MNSFLDIDVVPINKGLEAIKRIDAFLKEEHPELNQYIGDIKITVIDPHTDNSLVGAWSYFDDMTFEFNIDRS